MNHMINFGNAECPIFHIGPTTLPSVSLHNEIPPHQTGRPIGKQVSWDSHRNTIQASDVVPTKIWPNLTDRISCY